MIDVKTIVHPVLHLLFKFALNSKILEFIWMEFFIHTETIAQANLIRAGNGFMKKN